MRRAGGGGGGGSDTGRAAGVRRRRRSAQYCFNSFRNRAPLTILIMSACGALFGLIALLLIESLRFFERTPRRFERQPYLLSAAGGVALVFLYISRPATRTRVWGLTRSTECWRARCRSALARFSLRSWRPRSRRDVRGRGPHRLLNLRVDLDQDKGGRDCCAAHVVLQA
jgi:uncharacterized membrane protein YbhN (UPF0104 family)